MIVLLYAIEWYSVVERLRCMPGAFFIFRIRQYGWPDDRQNVAGQESIKWRTPKDECKSLSKLHYRIERKNRYKRTSMIFRGGTKMKKLMMAAALAAGTAALTASVCFAEDTYKVGVVKFVDHASLNQIQDSLVATLESLGEENGVTFEILDYNGNADGSQLQQIGAELVSEEADVIVAIATPAAQILQAATEDEEIPIIFSAVTDPVGANLVASLDAPGGNMTGTSDALNTETMMNLIFAADPEADKIGLLYSNSEDASKLPIEEAKAFLDEKGVAYVEKTGTTTDEVNAAVDALIAEEVDAIFTPTDNTIMNAELAIFEKLQEAGIPHYAGADSFALNGAFLGFGVNYVDLGIETANMTAELLLEGKAAAEMPVVTFDSGIATINTDTAEVLGMDLAAIEEAFAPYCSEIVETITAQNFSDVEAATE